MNNTIVPNENGSDFTVLPEPPAELFAAVCNPPRSVLRDWELVCADRAKAEAYVEEANVRDRRIPDPVRWRVVRYVRAA